MIVAGGVYEPGRVKGLPVMVDAYTMGKNV